MQMSKMIRYFVFSLFCLFSFSAHAQYRDTLARSDGHMNRDVLGEFIEHHVNKPTRVARSTPKVRNTSSTKQRDVLGEFIEKRGIQNPYRFTQRPRYQFPQNYQQREIEVLAKMMFFETGNRPGHEQLAVAHATLNRVNHPEFPNSVQAVVSQRGQYQWYHNASLRRGRVFRPNEHPEIMRRAREIYYQHLSGVRQDFTHGAIFFSSNGVRPAPRAISPQRIGAHAFYKLRPIHRNL